MKNLKNNIEQTCIEFGKFVTAKEDWTASTEYMTELWKQFQELQAKKVLDILDDIQSNNKSDDLEFGSTQAKINHEMLMLVKELQAEYAAAEAEFAKARKDYDDKKIKWDGVKPYVTKMMDIESQIAALACIIDTKVLELSFKSSLR